MDKLLMWYKNNKREMPWRETKDPYKIWLSEIILQQTRVNQGTSYYNRFVERFPNIFDLAKASEDEVLLLWQGLGYYSRARNLHATAKYIVEHCDGVFPGNYNDIIKLKGIGDYTASSIASLAFNEAEAAVDGNVYRVLARYFADPTPIGSSKGKTRFKLLAMELLNKKNPGIHNQAMIELGAVVCLPGNPKCLQCPIQEGCIAYNKNNVMGYPVKAKANKQSVRYVYFVILEKRGTFYIEKRIGKDIWQGLFQFPIIESTKELNVPVIVGQFANKIGMDKNEIVINKISAPVRHVLSHQVILGRFIHIRCSQTSNISVDKYISAASLDNYAMPRIITRYLENNRVEL